MMTTLIVPTMPDAGEIVRLGQGTYGRVVSKSIIEEDGAYRVALRVVPIPETDLDRIDWSVDSAEIEAVT